MKRVTPWCVLVAVLTLIAMPMFAQDQSQADKRISDLEKKVQQLEQEKEAPKLRLMNNAEEVRALEPVGLSSFYDNGYLVWSSNDGAFKYWLDGRLMVDAATYKGAENRLASGAEIRRGRLGVKATLYKNWLTEIDVDFTDNAVEMKDMWAGYAGFKNSLVRVGNYKTPFGLESLISSKYITFIERPYIDSWSPDRRLGIGASRWGSNWQASAGAFGQAGGEFNDKDSLTGGGAGTSQHVNFVGRFSMAPLNEKGRTLHVGIAGAHMKPDLAKLATSGSDLYDRIAAAQIVKFDSRAESHVSRAKFLSTGDMKYVDSYDMIGLEGAGVFGPVHFQAEYQTVDLKRTGKTTTANVVGHNFSGYYGQVAWFPTGEVRPYSSSEGEFGRIIPTHPFGALELALRYSTLDLNDITTVDPIKGGSAKNITAGVNWYVNANHRIMFNVTQVNNDEFAKPGKDFAPIPPGNSTAQNVVYGDDFTVIALRYSVAF